MGVDQSSYLYLRKHTYYFSRRVPPDMQGLYSGNRIVKSLRTRSRRVALRGSQQINFQLENHWSSIRVERITSGLAAAPISYADPIAGCGFDILDTRDCYMSLKGKGKGDKFERTVDRNIDYFINAVGNKDLSVYKSIDGAKFRDSLIEKGLAMSSIKRIFSSLSPMFKLVIQEHGLDAINPLIGTYMPEGEDRDKRQPIPASTINTIQSACVEIDDDLRWIVALVSDTGMRLAEACGLKASDIVLDSPIPHVIIQPNEARRLKTKSSKRAVPLVGMSLWAAQQTLLVPYRKEGSYLFPRYTKGGQCNANSASAALNKWLKSFVDDGCVMHSFRHSMRDRLRAIECPSDIVDQIGGWSRSSVGESYGSGYPVEVLHKWLSKIG